MSTDLFIYTAAKTPISHDVLHVAARKAKWRLAVLKRRTRIEADASPLEVDAIYDVYGAKKPDVLERGVAARLKGDHKTLDRLHRKEGLNGVYLQIVDPEDVDQYALQYIINGHGGDLQYALWEALGKVIPGVMEDPQSGDSKRCGPPLRPGST